MSYEIEEIRWVRHAARMGERRNAYRVLVGKHEGKKPFGRSRHRWKDDIKWMLRKYDGRMWGVDWINVAPGMGR